ncbi:MAG: hypothetical protein SOR90_09975, partial [Oscillospiraceae bacterium]|nr:hypothetical protein [Oscillospiraceae bacterium]
PNRSPLKLYSDARRAKTLTSSPAFWAFSWAGQSAQRFCRAANPLDRKTALSCRKVTYLPVSGKSDIVTFLSIFILQDYPNNQKNDDFMRKNSELSLTDPLHWTIVSLRCAT